MGSWARRHVVRKAEDELSRVSSPAWVSPPQTGSRQHTLHTTAVRPGSIRTLSYKYVSYCELQRDDDPTGSSQLRWGQSRSRVRATGPSELPWVFTHMDSAGPVLFSEIRTSSKLNKTFEQMDPFEQNRLPRSSGSVCKWVWSVEHRRQNTETGLIM